MCIGLEEDCVGWGYGKGHLGLLEPAYEEGCFP